MLYYLHVEVGLAWVNDLESGLGLDFTVAGSVRLMVRSGLVSAVDSKTRWGGGSDDVPFAAGRHQLPSRHRLDSRRSRQDRPAEDPQLLTCHLAAGAVGAAAALRAS